MLLEGIVVLTREDEEVYITRSLIICIILDVLFIAALETLPNANFASVLRCGAP
jgi:hypothetical protein